MQWFIVPDLDGPISGGTHYNRMLIAALKSANVRCEVLSLDRAAPVLARARARARDSIWIDSLYLDEVPGLARAVSPGARLGLLVHYLPSLIAVGESLGPQDLTPNETAALRAAAMFLVPSPFMREILRRVADPSRPILQVEPGRSTMVPVALPEAPPVRAVIVANLVPGKGIEGFLLNLAERIGETDGLYLDVVGGATQDPSCAERCRAAGGDPRLRGRVRFLGELAHEETLGRLAASNLLVSSSHVESYGMALAEARAVGIPILALRGGHVAAMVGRDSGGEVVETTADLVSACLVLCRDPIEHRRRMVRSRVRMLPARPWSQAAAEFLAQLGALDSPTSRGRGRESARAHDGG
jgi:glycosyltransferase involved in cell wall biosynthesis